MRLGSFVTTSLLDLVLPDDSSISRVAGALPPQKENEITKRKSPHPLGKAACAAVSAMPPNPRAQASVPVLDSHLSHLQMACMADHLWTPFAVLASSPKGAGLAVLVIYLVIVIFWAPLRILAFLITANGTYMLLIAAIFVLGRSVATYLSYPGAFKTVQVTPSRSLARILVLPCFAFDRSSITLVLDLRKPSCFALRL